MAPDSLHSRSHPLLLAVMRGGIAGVLIAVGLHFGYVLLGSNFRAVIPGKLYRCGQPSGRNLERYIRQHGIRTVVNLRGSCVSSDWYRDEARATNSACASPTDGVSQEDLGFSAARLPSTSSIRQLIEVFDRASYPMLLHCHQGADRTGLAVVVFFLLRPDTSYAEARHQLGPASGHVPVGKTRFIDRFFDLYEEWLSYHQRTHTPATFRDWACNHYCPGEGRAEFTLVDPVPRPETTLRLTAGQARTLTVRCRNTSIRTWKMQPGPNAGIHLIWYLVDHDERIVTVNRSGLFEKRVATGDHIDLHILLPGLMTGRYQLRVDLYDAQQGSFLQLGNAIMVADLEVS